MKDSERSMRRSFDASEWRGALDLFEARQISLDFEGLIVADQNDGRELEKLQILTFLNSRPHSLAPVDDLKAQLLEGECSAGCAEGPQKTGYRNSFQRDPQR